MIEYMGNGRRILNILLCMLTDCQCVLVHLKDGQTLTSCSSLELSDFMLNQGFADVFLLRINLGGIHAIQNEC